MQIFVPKEANPEEKRVAAVPASRRQIGQIGRQVRIEAGLGRSDLFFRRRLHRGGSHRGGRSQRPAWRAADIVLRLGKPAPDEIDSLKPGCIHISYLDPFNEPELLQQLAKAGVSAICMEMIPRSTICQKMDALSSQANLGGYEAVIRAARYSIKIFPMMTTPAGTILPSKVFIIGVGVAGLQAIATAKRLGAKVTRL